LGSLSKDYRDFLKGWYIIHRDYTEELGLDQDTKTSQKQDENLEESREGTMEYSSNII